MKSLWTMMIIVITVIILIFIYAYIYYPFVKVPVVVEDVKKDTSEGIEIPEDTNSLFLKDNESDVAPAEDPVMFTFNRNQPEVMQQFYLKYSGMTDMAALEANLKKQDYISVLKALWSEKDSSKRINWLLSKEKENHPLLLFELALEEFKNNPTIDHFQRAIYLLELGKYLTDIDAICISDSSVKSASHSLYANYAQAIGHVLKQNPDLMNQVHNDLTNELSKDVLEKLLTTLNSIEQNIDLLPQPTWVINHSLKKLLNDDKILKPKGQCQEERLRLIKKIKAQLEAEINKL